MTNTNANKEKYKCKQWACASSEKGNFLLPKAEKVEQFYVKYKYKQWTIQMKQWQIQMLKMTNAKNDKYKCKQ